MLKIGLTGGIGSGKTRVSDLLSSWGASVVDTDAIAHDTTAAGGSAIEALLQSFGAAAIRADGAMDRDWMRTRVFNDPDARIALEAIVHPLISAETARRAAQAEGDYLVFVVPLLVESGRWVSQVDRVCVVDCEPDTQVLRVQQRDGGMLGAGERRGSKASLRGNRNSWSQPCWGRVAESVIVEGVWWVCGVGTRCSGSLTGKLDLVGRGRRQGAGNVGEFEVEV